MLSFSDFPFRDAETFPFSGSVLRYLEDFCEHFKISRFMRFGCTVVRVAQRGEKWRVEHTTRDGAGESTDFDFVIICSGLQSSPAIPDLPGLKDFKGKLMHSSEYKSNNEFTGKRVLVVGGSYSGAEIAAQISQVTKSYLSIRRSHYLIPRFCSTPEFQNVPFDFLFFRRKSTIGTPTEENIEGHEFLESICGDASQVHPLLATDKSVPPLPNINDTLLDAVKEKRVELFSRLKGIEGNLAVFEDNSIVEVDVILFATGYTLELPFMDDSMKRTIKYDSRDLTQPVILYESTFHPELKNLAFVGIFNGTLPGSIEMQSHWVCSVFSGKTQLSLEEMLVGLKKEESIRAVPYENRSQLPDYVDRIDNYARRAQLYPSQELINITGKPVTSANYNQYHWKTCHFC
uniref:Flavin-containing monooxygenase n=1 Tax=Arcella intermedia TaxID=1963864 RepID=A0A6B2L5Z6_9EUKA